MGYLSQRKKHERESIFLKISSVAFVFLTILSFIPASGGIFPDLLFHFYFLNFLLFAYSVYVGRFIYGGIFLFLLAVNFFHVSAFANILFNTRNAGSHEVSLRYTSGFEADLAQSDVLVLRSGYLELGLPAEIRYWEVEKDNRAFNLIRVDLSETTSSERDKALRQLAAFVDTQNDPVILYGNFGEAAWSSSMRKFLQKTGLKVKNHLVFAAEGKAFDFFALPCFYVLSFSGLGIEDLSVASPQADSFPFVSLRLRFE